MLFTRTSIRWATLASAVLAGSLTGGLWADAGGSGQPMHQQKMASASTQQAPEGFVIFDERVVYLMANEPQNHFIRAFQDLSQKDNKRAGAELNIAASYVDMLSTQAQGQDKQTLSNCADRLRTDAKQIASGQQQDIKQLSKDFAQANLALAGHFQSAADASLKAKKDVRAGHDMQAAADSYRQALAWSSQKPGTKDVQAIQDAQQCANQLMGGQPAQNQPKNPQQINQALASQIQQLNGQITGAGATANER